MVLPQDLTLGIDIMIVCLVFSFFSEWGGGTDCCSLGRGAGGGGWGEAGTTWGQGISLGGRVADPGAPRCGVSGQGCYRAELEAARKVRYLNVIASTNRSTRPSVGLFCRE